MGNLQRAEHGFYIFILLLLPFFDFFLSGAVYAKLSEIIGIPFQLNFMATDFWYCFVKSVEEAPFLGLTWLPACHDGNFLLRARKFPFNIITQSSLLPSRSLPSYAPFRWESEKGDGRKTLWKVCDGRTNERTNERVIHLRGRPVWFMSLWRGSRM